MQLHENKRLNELDALRGIAAIMVVVCHCTLFHEEYTFKYGGIGVDLFFMLSGFVIFMTLNYVKTGKEFVIKRFARLYPVYWACLTLTLLLIVIDYHINYQKPLPDGLFIDYAVGLTMLQRIVGINDLDGPYWSLAVELVFYALMFLLYKLKLLHRTVPVLFVIALVELIMQLLLHYLPRTGIVGNIYQIEASLLLPHFIPLFLAGILFYQIYDGKKGISNYLLIALCFVMQTFEHESRHIEMFNMVPGEYNATLAVFFFLFILFVNGKLGFIVNGVTLFLGRISYALYLFHQYIIIRFIIPYFNGVLHLSYFVTCIIAITIVIAIATLNTFLIDEPLRKKIKTSLLNKHRIPVKKPL
jgi:peptidoglycan/LPS O-acetylase OafA/YrhL